MADHWKGCMTRLIAAVEASGAQDDFIAQAFGTKRGNGKSESDLINDLRRAVNEAKACLAMYSGDPHG